MSCCFLVFQIHFRHLDGELLFHIYTKLMASPGISAHFLFSSVSVNSHSLNAVYRYCLYSQTQSKGALGFGSREVLKGHAGLFQSAGSILSFYLTGCALICVQGSFENSLSGREL